MAKTLIQIREQIEKLEKEAERVRANEVAGVIQRVKTAIGFYGLTVEDLFGASRKIAAKRKKAAPKTRKIKKSPAPAKFMDKETGKTWTGHGKRPGWFVKAIEGGMQAQEMAV